MRAEDLVSLTKTQYVYLIIRGAILSGEYEENSKIVISNIAENLNLSIIPVREAMRKLEAEKLVSLVAHVGFVVNSFSIKEMGDGINIREILEPWAASLVLKNITEEDIKILRDLIVEMDKYAKENNYRMYGSLNKEFHQTIYEASGNETLYQIINNLWLKTERLRGIFRSDPTRMKQSNEEHKKLKKKLSLIIF